MVDKQYCMSSYLAFRYIEDNERDFYEGLRHKVMPVVPEEEKHRSKVPRISTARSRRYLIDSPASIWGSFSAAAWIQHALRPTCRARTPIPFVF